MDVGDQDIVCLRQFRIVSDGIDIEHAVSELEHNACMVYRRDLHIAIFRFKRVRCCRLKRRRRSLRSSSLTAATTTTSVATTTTLGTGAAATTVTTTAAAVLLLSETENRDGKNDAYH